jgi:Holliday junction DNA helicase RuvA
MSILSLLTPKKLALVIAAEDTKAISRAPGVGAKTAARVVLELKEKVAKNFPQFAADNTAEPDVPSASAKPAKSGSLADARDALVVLGYSRSEVTAAMKNVDPAQSTETIIKQALAVLMKN